MKKFYTEKKNYEINFEKSFHQIRLNNTIKNIDLYNDDMAIKIKEKLNAAIHTGTINIIEKEINKENEKESEKENEAENKKYIEKLISIYKDYFIFEINKNKNNKLQIIKHVCSDKLYLTTQIINFENIYIHLYNNSEKTYSYDRKIMDEYTKYYEMNKLFLEIPYLYINSKNEYILYYLKDINTEFDKKNDHSTTPYIKTNMKNIINPSSKPITNIPISFIKNYEIKYELNIFKYLLGNNYKIKYLIFYFLYFLKNIRNKQKGKKYDKKNIPTDDLNNMTYCVMSLYSFKTNELLNNDILQLMNILLMTYNSYNKEIRDKMMIFELENFYKLIIHCSLQKRMKTKKQITIEKILTYTNIYYDKNIKNITKNENICLEIAMETYGKLNELLKKYICKLLLIKNDNIEDLTNNIIYLVC